MAIDAVKEKKVEELKKDIYNTDLSRNELNKLNAMIDELPIENDNQINSNISDMDIEKVKEQEKQEFSINTNQQIQNEKSDDERLNEILKKMNSVSSFGKKKEIQDDSITQSFEPFLKNNHEEENKSKIENLDNLKFQANQLNDQIINLISYFEPYMSIPKVNNEINKIIAKNNEINNNPIINSENDYKSVIEIKNRILDYLKNAKNFIESNKKEDEANNLNIPKNYGHINTLIVLLLLAITLITFIVF